MDIDLIDFSLCFPPDLFCSSSPLHSKFHRNSSLMASLPFSNSDARLFSNGSLALSASTIRNLPVAPHPGPRFSDFQFRTIGQQPELLKRISAPNPEMQYDRDSDLLSPPLLDQPTQALTPPEGDSAKRPSLRDRLSLLESPPTRRDQNGDITMANPPELRPAFDLRTKQNVPPITTSTTQGSGLSGSSPQNLRTSFPQNRGLRKEPDLQDMIYKEKAMKKAGAASTSNESRLPSITGSETVHRISPPFVQSLTQANGVSPFSSGETVPSLAALRTLQSRLSSSLSNFNPISTVNALAAAQSAKDQCTEILATAHRAHTLAQQASLSAQDSMVAAQECLTVAAAVQNRADLALSAVEKIRSGQEIGTKGECEYNASVKTLKDDFHQLTEWLSQWDAYESKRQLEERENENRKKKLTLQLEHDLKNKFSTKKQSYDIITHGEPSMISIPKAMTVEDEAYAATRAWNQHREQSAERRRLADDESRKREAEAELERQKLQAQFEADARHAELEKKLQAEKQKAKEDEKARQEKELSELQRQQQEMEITRFFRSQKQGQYDLAKFAEEEKKKAQVAEAEKDLLKRHNMAETEPKREVILERMKCPAMAAQLPVSADTSISDRTKEKQSTACLTAPPSQHTSLSSTLPSAPIHAEFGNVVSKKTLLTNSPQTMQQKRPLPGTIRLDEFSNSTNPTSSIPSVPKSSTVMENGAKSHNVPSGISSSIDKPHLPNSSTTRMPSDHIHEADRKSGDDVCNRGSSRLSSSSSLPPLTPSLSMSPVLDPHATNSKDLEDTHSEINIHYTGPDMGNVSVVPPSLIPPVSLEAQRANLRPFMDENGITCGPGASGVNGRNHSSSRKPLSSSQMNGDQMRRTSSASNHGTEKKVKLEPVHDLVLPAPPAPRITKDAPTYPGPAAKAKLPDLKKNRISPPTVTQEASSSSKELASQIILPLDSLVQPLEPAVTRLNGSASANSSIPSKPKERGRPAAVRRNVPPLASNGQTPSLEEVMNQAFQGNDLDLPVSPRMGPDAALTDGWAQPTADDPSSKGHRKQLPSLDRSSPYSIIPPISRLVPPQRPRPAPRIDHYSPPRRIPDKDYSRDRRRSGSVEYARGGLSPQSKYNDDRRSLLSDDMPPAIGRKRYRDDVSDDAPPPRRPRTPFHRDDYVQPSLALRLESEKPWNAHGGSSYRPIYNDSNSYSYDTQSRNTKNQRHPSFRSQPSPQGLSYYDDSPPSTHSNQQRQYGRNDNTNDTRLPLLSRFTDSAEQTRGPRGGGNQALEQRISKPKSVPLLHRLEDAN